MKRFARSALFLGALVGPIFGATAIATITSAEPFALDGHSVNTPGVTSFPVVLGDTVSTVRGPAVLLFSDGSAMKLGANSSVQIAGEEAKPKVVLLAGALDYKLVRGSSLSVTNLDSEHRAVNAAPRPAPAATLELEPGAIAELPQTSPGQPGEGSRATSATYTGSDTTTGGNWTGKYGTDGQLIATDVTNPPPYASVSLMGDATSVLAANSNDPRALQVSSGSSTRIASSYTNNFSIDLNLTDGNAHRLSMYLCDFESSGRSETVSFIDAATKTVLSTQTFSSFGGGVYEMWDVKGHVQIQIASSGTGSAIVNGIFFDPPGAAASGPGSSGASATPNAHTPLFENPKFLIPVAGVAAAGLAAGLLSLPPVSRHL